MKNIYKIKETVQWKAIRWTWKILSGHFTMDCYRIFLKQRNTTNLELLQKISQTDPASAALIANGLMQFGTTTDGGDILRDRLRSTEADNWNVFNAVAAVGLIHKVSLLRIL
jgi:hypothetical protein